MALSLSSSQPRCGVKSPLNLFPLLLRASLCSLAFLAVLPACSRNKQSSRELPSGRYVQPDVSSTPEQSRSLAEELQQELSTGLNPLLEEMLQRGGASELSGRHIALLSAALAKTFSESMTLRVGNSSATHCVAAPDKPSAYLNCLFFEVVEDHFANGRDAQKWLLALSKADKKTGRATLSEKDAQEMISSAPKLLVSAFSNTAAVEMLLAKLSRAVDGTIRALEILAVQQVSMDLPYIGESFIQGRRFVLTTSLQQGSSGSSRVFNLDSMIVELKVNNNRLVVLRSAEGLYAGSSQEDLIVGAYPIVRTIEVKDGQEKYYQVDLSRPENKSFLVTAMGAGGEPSLQMSADVVVPKVAHAAKPVIAGMTNGLYFNSSDVSLVVDQLVLLNSNVPFLGSDDEAGEEGTGKDPIRPTVHIVQGFFPIPSAKDPFAEAQALPMSIAQMELRSRGVNDRTEGKDVPFFATEPLFESNGGRAREAVSYVRKFNTEKDVTFVISRGVPSAVVPAIQSAVESYAELFSALAPSGKPSMRISAVTQDEFEAAHLKSGLAIGSGVNAADPRVSMIYWDDSFAIGSAWATAAANPKTGEIISGDVMLTGSMWAMEGCKSYFAKTWQKDKEPKLPKRPAGTVPSPVSRFLWEAKCDAALANLGIFSKRAAAPAALPNPVALPNPAALEAFDEANRTGDLYALAQMASELLGRDVSPSEMVSDASRFLPNPLSHSAELTRFSAGVRSLLDLGGSLKKLVESRTARFEKLFSDDTQSSSLRKYGTRENFFHARLDCVKNFNPNAELSMAESGSPAITSELVNSPEAGALSLVRSVVVHELGHVFGLRHNFIASTTPAVLAEDAKTPVAVDRFSDSVMDYNDYGIDMGAGAMKDYTSAQGASGLPTFGVYDVLALASIYMLPSEGIKFKTPTEFCTDRNVGPLGNCQRFDYGKDFNEYSIHRANLMLQRLRYASPMDAVLDPRAPAAYAQLVKSYGQEMGKLSALWALAQSAAHDATDHASRKKLLEISELAFRGQGSKQGFLTEFKAKYGVDPVGVKGSLELTPSFFASPEYGAVIADLVRKDVEVSMMAVVRLLQGRARKAGSDAAYTGVVYNLSEAGAKFNYLDELVEYFAQQVILPQGTAAPFEFFDDGQRKDASQATLDGKPFLFNLPAPFFNHRSHVIAVPNVSIDGPAPGSRKSVTLLVEGQKSIEDMLVSIAALSVLAGENPEHPALLRLTEQALVLKNLLEGEPCVAAAKLGSANPSVAGADANVSALVSSCELLRDDARAPAAIVLNSILAAGQGALPTMTVASEETDF
jgi:hypothetical protein